MSFEDLASRLGIDTEDFIELVELFITTTRSDMDKIRSAMDGNKPSDASAAAHSIKGAAANLGYEGMADIAQTMEALGKDGSLDGFEGYMSELDENVTGLQDKLAGE